MSNMWLLYSENTIHDVEEKITDLLSIFQFFFLEVPDEFILLFWLALSKDNTNKLLANLNPW